MRLTKKQQDIMEQVIAATATGSWVDIDQIQEALGSGASKQALQCSIRFLEAKKFVTREYETRRERKRMLVVPTMEGFDAFKTAMAIISTPGICLTP